MWNETRRVVLGLIAFMLAAVPAHAVPTSLDFQEHTGVLTGLDHTDITEIEAANELKLGFAIDFLGKLDGTNPGKWEPNTALNPSFALLAPDFTCTSGGTDADCQGNFTIDIDFSVLANPDWQLVKIVVKAGNDPLEDWLTGLVPHNPQQQAVVSPRDADAGVSNLLLFGTTTTPAVPAPSSLLLIGMGLVGLGAWARRRSR